MPPNRIREIRQARGLSSEALAAQIGTSGASVRRMETGHQPVTVDMMRKLSVALQCAPSDLIAVAAMVETDNEVEPAALPHNGVDAALRRRGMAIYRVTGRSLENAGIRPGDIITVDRSPDAIADAANASPVIVEIENPPVLVLRQFIRPGLLVTNRDGANLAVSLTDRSVPMRIVGVVIRD